MRSLSLKLLAAFVVVAAVAVATAAITATRATDSAFTQYVRQGQTARLQALQQSLADFYGRNRSWAGVQSLLDSSASPVGRMGQGMGMGLGRGGPAMGMDTQLILADAQGTVIAAAGTPNAGPRLTAREVATGLPITVDGKTVGIVLAQGAGMSSFSAVEQSFVSKVNQGSLLASLLAGSLAVVVGLVISRRITAPLTSMTHAAEAMAHGDLSQRVRVESNDEVGRLAQAFNTMAASVARAEQLRRDLVADVAHELRTPVAVLRADLEAVQDGVYQPTAERMGALREEVDLLARLVADLQELSLAEAGQLTLERRPTDLKQLCDQVAAAMEPQAAARGIRLVVAASAAGATSVVDADRMGQVLRNLVSNALRYTPAHGSVELNCEISGAEVILSVRDTGSGIAPGDLPHIFDRFYRGERSRARATGGVGLGLAIVKQLAEAHGGRVWAESTPGQGSTFYVSLPRSEDGRL